MYIRKEDRTAIYESPLTSDGLSATNHAKNSPVMSFDLLEQERIDEELRVKRLSDTVEYAGRSTKLMLGKYISETVERALLLDKDALSDMNPLYRSEIHTIVEGMLSTVTDFTSSDRRVSAVLESISRSLPSANVGILMEDDELTKAATSLDAENKKVDKLLDDISSDVKSAVADIVDSEQKDERKVNADMNEIMAITEASRAETKRLQEKDAPVEEVPEDDMGEMPAEGEEDYEEPEYEEDEATEYDESPEEGEPEYEEQYDDAQYDDGQSYAPEAPLPAKKGKETKIEISPDGGLKINIKESADAINKPLPSAIYHKGPHGLIECIALNNAEKYLQETGKINTEKAIADAMIYVTILETFDRFGIIAFDEMGKNRLCEELGGTRGDYFYLNN